MAPSGAADLSPGGVWQRLTSPAAPFDVDERVAELRECLERRTDLVPYKDVDGRECPWQKGAAGSDAGLRRFLVARQGDVSRAADMYAAHLKWRRQVFPLPRTGKVAKILDDGRRFSRLPDRDDGVPVLMVHNMWGHFLSEEVTALDCLRACVRFLEDEIALAEANGHQKAVCVSFGGPPVIGFVSALAAVLTANYPERLLTACIYPVPKFVSRFVWAMLWFLDEGTRQKVSIHYEEHTLLERVGYRAEQLPEDMRGGFVGVSKRFRPDTARLNRLMREGLLQNRGEAAELQRRLLEEPAQDETAPPTPCIEVAKADSGISIWPSTWLACCCAARGGDDLSPCSPGRGRPALQRAFGETAPKFDAVAEREIEISCRKACAGRPSNIFMALMLAMLVAMGLPLVLAERV